MKGHTSHTMEHKWTTLLVMAVLSFLAMYALMYAMVDRLDNVYSNLNQFYMAALMTAPMMLIEIALMRSMYSARVVAATAIISLVVGVFSFIGIRSQIGIADKEFLRSMISHHGAALLMCERAPLGDAEIIELCEGIIAGQQSEIDWMENKLSTME
ncbi:MAG: DUF305 domain-containing protein [Anaerolineales bacterium]